MKWISVIPRFEKDIVSLYQRTDLLTHEMAGFVTDSNDRSIVWFARVFVHTVLYTENRADLFLGTFNVISLFFWPCTISTSGICKKKIQTFDSNCFYLAKYGIWIVLVQNWEWDMGKLCGCLFYYSIWTSHYRVNEKKNEVI